ncbi:MAG: hypothetical protein P4L33_18570 [Capsulimonadaceae bacterium]|nr:hypothetical protein [Capsulimonadaceae bacterium]
MIRESAHAIASYEPKQAPSAGKPRNSDDAEALGAALIVSAVAVVSVFLGTIIFPSSGPVSQRVEFPRFECIAAICLVGWVGGVAWLRRHGMPSGLQGALLLGGAACICLCASVWYIVQSRVPAFVAIFGILGAYIALRTSHRIPIRKGRRDVTCVASLAIAAWCASTAITAATWRQLWWIGPSHIDGCLPLIAVITAICALFVELYLLPPAKRVHRCGWRICGAALMLICAFLAAFCPNWLGNYTVLAHYAVYVEPAIMIRHGHWLLWDITAQYGYLTTCLIAAMPFRSAWYGFYILNATLMVVASLLFYYIVVSASNHRWHVFTAVIVAFVPFFIVPGALNDGFPPSCFPSTTAFRFLWCYAAIALLVWEHGRPSTLQITRGVLAAGTVMWAICILWSAETGVYATALWGPAYLFLTHRCHVQTQSRTGLLGWFKACLIPPALLLVFAAVIECLYRLRLGHGPDWTLLAAYAMAFKQGFGWLPPDTSGPLWLLLIAFVIPAILACWFAWRRGPAHRSLPLLSACAGMVLATSTYYVGRSADSNVNNLDPIMVMSLCACWLVLSTERLNFCLKGLLVAMIFPMIVMPLYLITRQCIAPGTLTQRFSPPVAMNSFHLGNRNGVEVNALLHAGYHRGDAVLDAGLSPMQVLTAGTDEGIADAPRLLPIGPLEVSIPLGADRALRVADRYRVTGPKSGWVLAPDNDDSSPTDLKIAIAHYIRDNYSIDKLAPDYYGFSVLHCVRK